MNVRRIDLDAEAPSDESSSPTAERTDSGYTVRIPNGGIFIIGIHQNGEADNIFILDPNDYTLDIVATP